MTPNFTSDARREREDWLASMDMTEDDVQKDKKGREFIFIEISPEEIEDQKVFTRVPLPYPIQTVNTIDY